MKKYTRRDIFTILGATALSSSLIDIDFAYAQGISKETRSIMDTFVAIEVRHESADLRAKAISEAFELIERAVAIFDRHTSSSPLAILNKSGKLYDVPQELFYVMGIAKDFAHTSSHLFNPTVQPLVDYLLTSSSLSQSEYKDIRSSVKDMDAIQCGKSSIHFMHEGMGITLDGIAKGYIVDLATQSLAKNAIENYMVNAGGDLVVRGEQYKGIAWNIGIQSPYKKHHIVEYVALTQGAIATSGGYERYNTSNGYSHLVNPYTAKNPQVESVSVIAPTAIQADALATTLSMMRPQQALKYIEQYAGSACYIITKSGTVQSSNWKAYRA